MCGKKRRIKEKWKRRYTELSGVNQKKDTKKFV